jgi:hypothetical protein
MALNVREFVWLTVIIRVNQQPICLFWQREQQKETKAEHCLLNFVTFSASPK